MKYMMLFWVDESAEVLVSDGATRFDRKYGLPGLTHDQLMTTIELYGQQVVPRVRELLGCLGQGIGRAACGAPAA